jgi:hypothetical protein
MNNIVLSIMFKVRQQLSIYRNIPQGFKEFRGKHTYFILPVIS